MRKNKTLCRFRGCKRPHVKGGQYCYASHDGSTDPAGPHCMVAGCMMAKLALASNLCPDHAELYFLWRQRTDLSKIRGESSLYTWLAERADAQ